MNLEIRLEFNQTKWQVSFLEAIEKSPKKEDQKEEIEKAFGKAELKSSATPSNAKGFWEEQAAALSIDSLDVVQFQKQLTAHHTKYVTEVAAKIFFQKMKELHDLNGVCLAYTGSDGRQEKLSPYSSLLEMMLIVRKEKDLEESSLLQKIKAIVAEQRHLFYCDVEIRCLDTDSLICFNRNQDWKGVKDNRPFPTRALDAQFLIGDVSIFKDYKAQFYQELQKEESLKLLKDFKKCAVRTSVSLAKRAEDRSDVTHVDTRKGVVVYDGQRVKGTKYPFLRAMQYKLADFICEQVRKKKISLQEFMALPVTTVDRIGWLANQKFFAMSQEQVQAVQRSYVASLIWFGIAQKNYEVEGLRQTQLPGKDVRNVAKTIVTFCTGKNIFSNV